MWHIDLGSVELTATAMPQVLSYDEAADRLDVMVSSLRFTG